MKTFIDFILLAQGNPQTAQDFIAKLEAKDVTELENFFNSSGGGYQPNANEIKNMIDAYDNIKAVVGSYVTNNIGPLAY